MLFFDLQLQAIAMALLWGSIAIVEVIPGICVTRQRLHIRLFKFGDSFALVLWLTSTRLRL